MGKRCVQLQVQTENVNLSDMPKHQTLRRLLCKTGRAHLHASTLLLADTVRFSAAAVQLVHLLQAPRCTDMVWCGYGVGVVWV